MRGKGHTWAWSLAGIAICGISLTSYACLPARTTTPPSEANAAKNEDLNNFRTTLLRIANEGHVGFVIEGQPRPIVFARLRDQVKALPAVTPQGANLSQHVDLVAAAYDYSATRRGSLYLLRKKYTYPQDIPEISPAECSSAAAQILGVLTQMNHSTGAYDQQHELENLVGSLTPDQWSALLSKKFLLVGTDLTNEQRASVKDFVLQQYMLGSIGLMEPSVMLNPDNDPRFGRFTYNIKNPDARLGIIATTTTTAGRNDRFTPIPVAASQAIPPTPANNINNDDADLNMITVEAEEAAAAQVSGGSSSDIAISLQEAVRRLNDRRKNESPSRADSALTIAVDPLLGTKQVTIIGDEAASSSDIAAAIASIYGLRVQRSPDAPTVQKIARFPTPKIAEPSDGSLIMHQMLPAPFLTALRVDQEDALRALPTYNIARTQEQSDLMRRKWDQHQLILKHRRQVMESAARQLYAIVAPRLQNSVMIATADQSPIPVNALKPYAGAVASTYLMHSFVENMDTIMYPPWPLTHFDQMCFTCSADFSDKKRPKAMIGLCMYDEEKQSVGMKVMYTSVPLPENAPGQPGQ